MSNENLPPELKSGDFLGGFGQYGLRPEQIKYEPCFFAFLDILGYKKLLCTLGPDAPRYLYEILKTTFEFHRSSYESVKVKLLSDSILIWSTGGTAVHFWNVVNVVDLIRQSFMKKKLFVRGGISEGHNFIDQDIIISPALIKAWQLEQAADFPRILVDEAAIAIAFEGVVTDTIGQTYLKVASYVRRIHPEQIERDADGKSMLKSFSDSNGTYFLKTGLPIWHNPSDAPLTENQKLAIRAEGESELQAMRKLVLEMKPSDEDPKVLRKYNYVIEKFNTWIVQFGDLGASLEIKL